MCRCDDAVNTGTPRSCLSSTAVAVEFCRRLRCSWGSTADDCGFQTYPTPYKRVAPVTSHFQPRRLPTPHRKTSHRNLAVYNLAPRSLPTPWVSFSVSVEYSLVPQRYHSEEDVDASYGLTLSRFVKSCFNSVPHTDLSYYFGYFGPCRHIADLPLDLSVIRYAIIYLSQKYYLIHCLAITTLLN